MSRTLVFLAMVCACGGGSKDSDTSGGTTSPGTTSAGSTSAGTTSAGTTSAGSTTPTGTTTTGTGDGALTASGDYNGTPLDYTCFFDAQDAANQGDLQCQQIQFFAWCRPDPWDSVPGVSVMQLWFNLGTHLGVGTHDFDAASGGGISWGDGYSLPLAGWSANMVTNQITIDAVTPEVSASGSYTASWSDDGGNYGTVSGTFDFDCP